MYEILQNKFIVKFLFMIACVIISSRLWPWIACFDWVKRWKMNSMVPFPVSMITDINMFLYLEWYKLFQFLGSSIYLIQLSKRWDSYVCFVNFVSLQLIVGILYFSTYCIGSHLYPVFFLSPHYLSNTVTHMHFMHTVEKESLR